MSKPSPRNLFLPNKDRSYWKPKVELTSSLSYLAWGRRDFSQEFLPECRHEGWVCTIIEEGSPTMVIQGKPVKLVRRQLVFIGPDCSFGWPSIEGSSCKFIQWMWADIKLELAECLPRDTYIIRDLPHGKLRPLRENHNQCRREVLDVNVLSPEYLDACHQLFEILLQRVLEAPEQSDSAEVRITQAREWMQLHLDSKEPVARLCDYLDVSQSTLHRLFKAHADQSPIGYFHELRMQEAKRRLIQKQMQIKEVAYSLGYQHVNDFSRAYKSRYGCPPSRDQK